MHEVARGGYFVRSEPIEGASDTCVLGNDGKGDRNMMVDG